MRSEETGKVAGKVDLVEQFRIVSLRCMVSCEAGDLCRAWLVARDARPDLRCRAMTLGGFGGWWWWWSV